MKGGWRINQSVKQQKQDLVGQIYAEEQRQSDPSVRQLRDCKRFVFNFFTGFFAF